MNPHEVQSFVKKQPFDPFRIVMQSGKTYDVRHPRMLVVGRTWLHYFVYHDIEMEFHDEMQILGLEYVQRVELIEPEAVPNF